ncbi:hypothetical protein [Suttonella ornithocola]|uniref:Response regulatory domain-containing protein n=1 Tax=Suttonella ornithocola TaxID=279832 RepID=A0A380MT79_9GAMM|nr:hypothetical protein [Suttonella ornithocola]SUO95502.1 Uncharacterised protein [Suttonella ornithocola]
MNIENTTRNIILLYESETIFNRFHRVFGNNYQIFWGKDLNSTMDILAAKDIGVMICDVHYHNQDIYPVVLALKELHPELVTMIVTQSQDAEQIKHLEAQEEIFAALVRPITQEKLNHVLNEAYQQHLKQISDLPPEQEETSSHTSLVGLSLSEILHSAKIPEDIRQLDMLDLPEIEHKPAAPIEESEISAAINSTDIFFSDDEYTEPESPTLVPNTVNKIRTPRDQFFESIEYDE